MLSIAPINETIITTPGIRMNNAFYDNLSSNYRLKRLASTVRNNLGINLTIPLENPQNNRFSSGSSTPNTFNSPGSEKTLVDFDFIRNWRLLFTIIGDYLSYLHQIFIDRISMYAGQYHNLRGRKIQRKVPDNLPEFVVENRRSSFIPVNWFHDNNFTYFFHAKIVMTLIIYG